MFLLFFVLFLSRWLLFGFWNFLRYFRVQWHFLSLFLFLLLFLLLLLLFHVLIDSDEDSFRFLIWIPDLNKSMRVFSFIFTLHAVVEVLANRAFVSNSNDGEDIAAIASNSIMYNWVAVSRIRTLELCIFQFLEDDICHTVKLRADVLIY